MYVAPYFDNQKVLEPPPPVLADVDGEDHEYVHTEVENILDSRWSRNKLQYFIHWKGLPKSEDEWVNVDDISAGELIEQFHLKYHKKPPYDKKQNNRRGRRS